MSKTALERQRPRCRGALAQCRRRDSNARRADYDSRPSWLSHRGFEAGWTSRWTQPHLRPRRVLRCPGSPTSPQTAQGSARAGPIRASVGTGVGTRWEQIGSPHGCCCPLVSSSESLAVQGVLDENTAYGPARATFYGTEGQRFESSRARSGKPRSGGAFAFRGRPAPAPPSAVSARIRRSRTSPAQPRTGRLRWWRSRAAGTCRG